LGGLFRRSKNRNWDAKRPKFERRKQMDMQNRVLIRKGARELTPTEADLVNGGYRTLSLCTSAPTPDGDQHVGEVGC
jgi:hypothetical protein